MTNSTASTASKEEILDLIEAARYGELDTLQDFIAKYGSEGIKESVDEFGLTPLHMAAANGHEEVAKLLVEVLPAEYLIRKNERGNTPLHWAALNGHLAILRILVPLLEPEQLLIQNEAGDTAAELAEERGTEKMLECAGYIEARYPEDPEEMKDVKDEEVKPDESVEAGVNKMSLNAEKAATAESQRPIDQL